MANPHTGTEQRRSLERARRAFRCLRAFHGSADGVGSRTDLLRRTCRLAVEQGRYPCAWAAYAREGDHGNHLQPAALAGHCDGCAEGLEASEPVARAWTSAEPVSARIAAGGERWQRTAARLGLHSFIVIPLLRGDVACGVFVFFDTEENAFDREEAEVLQEWIQDTSRAIETLDLKRERERLLSIIDATPDFIAVIGAGNLITYCNPAAIATLGLSRRDELIGRPLQCCHPQWSIELIEQEAIPTALRDGYWQGEVALLAADGGEVPASQILLAHRPENGDTAYLSTIIRDLRPHRRSEAQLRSSEAAYRRIIHIAREGFRSVGGELSPPTAPVRTKVPVHQGNTVLLLDIDSICAVRAEGHYTRIYTHQGELFSGESFARPNAWSPMTSSFRPTAATSSTWTVSRRWNGPTRSIGCCSATSTPRSAAAVSTASGGHSASTENRDARRTVHRHLRPIHRRRMTTREKGIARYSRFHLTYRCEP